ncbi:MAG TPA: DUF4360 domain-containing protein [Oligoflexus sp.]|uniref:DUF4360 domain-containing protein n=1 Tax=Oligoflexus sp. TaxID=1971216 RepID=UPI002D2CA624|nr:DUF4360 domain-containing protein [Oligoflexus sp.]HYX32699.1 DUF4360 domain-containing protein [Oligoflexus sp.]
MKKSLIMLATLGFSPVGLASIASVESINSGDGCGDLRYDIAETSANSDAAQGIIGESLRVFFNDFHIQATQPGEVKRTCKLDAVIRIPAGYRFLPRAAYAEGSYSIKPQGASKGLINVTYDVRPAGRLAQRTNEKAPWSGEGDFTCRGDLVETQFLLCANHDTYVTLRTDLTLKLQQAAGGQSLIELDTARKDVDLAWDWQFKPCVNFFEGRTFRAYMKIGPTNTLPLRFQPYEDKGSLTTDSGKQGALSQVVYSDDGLSVSGNYTLDGKSGRFSVKVVDTEAGEFRGSLNGNDGSAGTFFGYYAD